MKNKNLNTKALLIATALSIVMIALVFFGSRKLQNFDAALITYLFGTVFAFFGIVYRYSVWLQRPPTWIYLPERCFLIFGLLPKSQLKILLFKSLFILEENTVGWRIL